MMRRKISSVDLLRQWAFNNLSTSDGRIVIQQNKQQFCNVCIINNINNHSVNNQLAVYAQSSSLSLEAVNVSCSQTYNSVCDAVVFKPNASVTLSQWTADDDCSDSVYCIAYRLTFIRSRLNATLSKALTCD